MDESEKEIRQRGERRTSETEKRRAEELIRTSKAMLQTIFDGISEPLLMLDRTGKVSMLNRPARDYYQLAAYVDAIGKPCYTAFFKLSAPCSGCTRPLSQLDGSEGSFERQSPVIPGRLEQVSIYSKKDDSGAEEARIVRITDITHAKLLERELVQKEKLASLGLLVSGIAHEINNPNNFISFNIPILREYLGAVLPIVSEYGANRPGFELFGMSCEEFEKDIFKLLENMEHGSNRINATITRLKGFARKRDMAERERIDIKTLIDRAVALCHSEIKKKIKSFEVSVPEQMPAIYTDAEILEQVLVNLLINAVHAADKKDSAIWVRARQGADPFCQCVIEVGDNGCGMTESTRQRVFDPFFTTKSPGLGTGLGLYVCQTFIEGLGGKIEVESRLGRGTTFKLSLFEKIGRV
ncbi:MAG: ATP-binding protein [Syntrophobacteraceae bacterium]